MKNLVMLFLCTIFLIMNLNAQVPSNGIVYQTEERGDNDLKLEIKKLKNDEGKVMIQLMDQDQNTLVYATSVIKDKFVSMTIPSLPSGTYALRYFHDKNNNDEFDTNAMGIPKEGFGCSNDARGFMSAPKFEDMLFELDGDIVLKMKTAN